MKEQRRDRKKSKETDKRGRRSFYTEDRRLLLQMLHHPTKSEKLESQNASGGNLKL